MKLNSQSASAGGWKELMELFKTQGYKTNMCAGFIDMDKGLTTWCIRLVILLVINYNLSTTFQFYLNMDNH